MKKERDMGAGNPTKAYLLTRRLLPYLALAAMLALSAAAWRFNRGVSQERDRRLFIGLVDRVVTDITGRLVRYTIILQGGAGLSLTLDEFTRDEWQAYYEYRQIHNTYPGVQGIGYAIVVRPDDLARHIEQIRAEGFPDYTVRPAGEREVYTSIIFLEPFDAVNQRAFGYDMFSESVRRKAMARARDTGEVALSGRVTLVQNLDGDARPGFLLYVPIYTRGMPLGTVADRRAALQGFVCAQFHMSDLLDAIFPDPIQEIGFAIHDGTEVSPSSLLCDNRISAAAPRAPLFTERRVLDLYGHQWLLDFQTMPAFEAQVDWQTSWVILGSGVVISLLLFLLLKMLSGSADRAQTVAEDDLRRSEERQRYILSVSPTLFYILRRDDHTPKWISPNVSALLGYTVDEVFEPGWWERHLHPEDRERALADALRVLETGHIEFTYRFLRKDGTVRWINDRMKLTHGPDHSEEIISAWNDITAHKQGEADRIARQVAEAATREKSRFLANMSHEIRTPMNAILGFAQIIERDPDLKPAHAKRVRSINRAGHHLLSLINDILDTAKIEAGMTELSPSAFSLHALLDDLPIMFRSRADAKGLHLMMERAPGVPLAVLADKTKLQQVFVNLLGNAVKFTRKGGVAVRVRTEPASPDLAGPTDDAQPAARSEGTVRLIVEVEDSGPGIPASDLEVIFEAFDQGEAGIAAGGTGLGLSISRKLVEMMGGTLTVQSEVGQGSCFRFDVRLEPTEALPEDKEPKFRRMVVGLAPGTGPWRILVVDDVQDNRDLLRDLLQSAGFEVREARNGKEALAVFAAWSPHAVLMDMRMPVMDGYEAIRRIKATEAGHATPIIAVTASVFTESEEEIRQAGVFAYLRKPFRPEEVYEILGKCLDLRYVYADEPDRTRERSAALTITPESVAVLPAELRRAMREAMDDGDVARLAEMIGQAQAINPAVATELKSLVDQYDYGKLEGLLANGENDNE